MEKLNLGFYTCFSCWSKFSAGYHSLSIRKIGNSEMGENLEELKWTFFMLWKFLKVVPKLTHQGLYGV